jgi:hypothetical protein
MASEKITDTPILVNVSENYHLASQLEGDHSRFDNIHIFGQPEIISGCKTVLDEELDELAIDIHGYYMQNKVSETDFEVILNRSAVMEDWQQLTVFKKEDNRAQADHIDTKLYLIGLRRIKKEMLKQEDRNRLISKEEYSYILNDEVLEKLARSEHERWNAIHFIFGWQTVPAHEKKDILNKKHHCLVEWEVLDRVSFEQSRMKGEYINYKKNDREVVKGLFDLLSSNGYALIRE